MNQFQLVCKCALLFVYLFPTPSKTSAFYFLTLVLGFCEMGKKEVCMDFCSVSTQVLFVTIKLK